MTTGAPADARPAAGTGALARLAARVRGLTGWRRGLLAATLGALAVAALPPVHLVPVLVPAFAGLVWQLEGARTRRGAFGVGWLFGLGFFGAGLYWVGIAFLVQADVHGWMMPFAVAGLAAGLAIFTGLTGLAVHVLPGRSTAARVLALTVAWMVASWLRGHVLTGFPWNLLATVWDPWPVMLQSASVWGAWGLSAVTLLAAAAPASLGDQEPGLRRWLPPLLAVAALAGLAAHGGARLHAAPAPGASAADGVRLRLVQPSIPQAAKQAPEKQQDHVQTYRELTRRPGFDAVTHVIWPETAVLMFMSRRDDLRDDLASLAPAGGALLTGLPRMADGPGGRQLYNSLYVVGSGGTTSRYDKFHLVPFGEYVPLEAWLPLPKLTTGPSGFTAGPGPRTLSVPGAPPVSPLICYEAIFPGEVTAPGTRPEWLLNVTNDAWFGRSSAPYQHLASARLRAIEEGLPLVRAANTGISAVVDPYGRTRARVGLYVTDIADARLPGARPPTLYARHADAGFAGILALLAAVYLGIARRT